MSEINASKYFPKNLRTVSMFFEGGWATPLMEAKKKRIKQGFALVLSILMGGIDHKPNCVPQPHVNSYLYTAHLREYKKSKRDPHCSTPPPPVHCLQEKEKCPQH